MPNKIDINSAPVSELTQLPGISKNIAYNIVNYRVRHGFFVTFDDLKTVKDFPSDKLGLIRERAVLIQPPEDRPNETVPPPRHSPDHVENAKKGTEAYTKSLRATRRPDRLNDSRDRSERSGEGKKSA